MKWDHFLIPFTKINSKWIKDLNVRPKTVRLLQENIGNKLIEIGLGSILLGISPRAKATEAKIKKNEPHQIKNLFVPQRKSLPKQNKTKGNLQSGRKYLPMKNLIRD